MSVNHLRPQDLVSLGGSYAWRGIVTRIEGNEALVLQTHIPDRFSSWIPLDLLELVPVRRDKQGRFRTIATNLEERAGP